MTKAARIEQAYILKDEVMYPIGKGIVKLKSTKTLSTPKNTTNKVKKKEPSCD